MVAEVHQTEAFAPARRLALTISVVGFGVTGVFLLGVYVLARRITRPIVAIKDTAVAVANGDLDAVAPVLTSDEVGVLGRAFNEMTARLRATLSGLERELSQRQRVEAALRKSEARWQFALEGAGDAVWDWDIATGRVFYSRRWQQMVGTPDAAPEDTLAAWERHIDPDDLPRVQQAIGEHLAGTTELFVAEYRIRRPDGTSRWILSRGRVVERDANGSARRFIGTNSDVTERRRMEEEQIALERHMFHTQKLESLGVLAGGVAHDFNNLLMAILGNLEIAVRELAEGTAARESVEHAEQAAHRASDLTRQLLAYSGKGKFIVRDIRLTDVVRECAQLLRSSIPHTIEFDLRLDASVPPIKADPGQIDQVVMNLVTNAAEAIGAGPGTISLSTGTSDLTAEELRGSRLEPVPPAGRFVWIEAIDTGHGMDAETARRMFEPFFTTKFTGRGLGMSAVLGILRGHHGAVFVDTAVGAGTRIRVVFPAVEEPVQALTPTQVRHASDRPLGHAGTILVVDDEEMVREVAARLVRSLGFDVATAVDGADAVRIVAEQPTAIVCVLLDLSMPRMDGTLAFGRLRALRPDLRIVLSSGYDEQATVQHLISQGLAGFLQKPYTLAALRETLARILRFQPPA